MKPKPLSAWCAAFSAIAAATVFAAAPERQTQPTSLSVSIQSAVSSDANDIWQYRYAIINTSPTLAIGAVSMQGTYVHGSGTGGRGWRQAPSVSFGPLTWRALGADTALQPGRAKVDLEINSTALPSVVRLTVFPAIMPQWDEPAPTGVTVDAIGPNVGSLSLEPLPAAVDIVKEVRSTLVGALRADGDDTADTLERDLRETLAALARMDVTAADAAIRDALAVGWQRASTWRTSLHRAFEIDLTYVLDLLGPAPDFRIRHMTAGPMLDLENLWTYPGVTSPSPVEIPALAAQTALGLVGTIEDVGIEHVDGDRPTETRTRLRVQPKEIFWGPAKQLDPLEIWIHGGVLTRWRQALSVHSTSAADTAFALKPGDVVFLAADRFSKPGSAMDGQYWIRAEDTFTVFDDGRMTIADKGRVRSSGLGRMDWIDAIVRQGRELTAANPFATQADMFLAAIRHGSTTPGR